MDQYLKYEDNVPLETIENEACLVDFGLDDETISRLASEHLDSIDTSLSMVGSFVRPESSNLSDESAIQDQAKMICKIFRCKMCAFKWSNGSCGHVPPDRQGITREKFQCTVCGFEAPSPQSLKRHGKKCHKPIFYCDHFDSKPCTYKSTSEKRYLRHASWHGGKHSFFCSLCSYSCFHKCTLTRHVRMKHSQADKL